MSSLYINHPELSGIFAADGASGSGIIKTNFRQQADNSWMQDGSKSWVKYVHNMCTKIQNDFKQMSQFIFQIFLKPFWAWLIYPLRVPVKVKERASYRYSERRLSNLWHG